ncbi:fimbrillin family protein [Prevotella sp. 20925_1_30]|uniref:fimbrillin family protein n=1 Tax=Prevotella sp. 20925_1_30 TaxID=3003679 RepID=UPI00352F702D
MKKQYFLAIAMFMLLTVFAACSSDDNLDNGKGKVDVASKFEFPVTFADYNSDVQVGNTRAAADASDTLKHEFVNMGNGIVADVTLQRDKENLSGNPAKAASTRTLTNDSYTMLAYQSGVLKGELKGFISGGNFIPNAGDPTAMSLAPGNYDFVLYSTSYFTRSGNNLTLTNANEYAILGRTNYTVTATPQKQKVSFAMKHTAARVRVKFNTYVKVQPSNFNVSFSAANPAEVPSSAVYDAATGTWSTSGTGGSFGFGGSAWTESGSVTYSYTSPSYSYIFPGSNITNLKATFGIATIYTENLYGKSLTFALTPVLASVANGSYLISITFHYNFLYLMTDGTTGLFSETTFGGGTKTPIAVVASQSKRLAAALNNASSFAYFSNTSYGTTHNSSQIPEPGWYQGFNRTSFDADGADGYKFTWEAAGSADGTTIKANEQTKYPAFYTAGHYVPTLPAGKFLTGSIVGKKWFLPSAGEIAKLYTGVRTGAGLNYEPQSMGGGMYSTTFYEDHILQYNPAAPLGMLGMAFRQVGGESPNDILTSSTIGNSYFTMSLLDLRKDNGGGSIRPFIHY